MVTEEVVLTGEERKLAVGVLEKFGVEADVDWDGEDFQEEMIDALMEDEMLVNSLTDEEQDLLIKLDVLEAEEDEEVEEEEEEDEEVEEEEEEEEEKPAPKKKKKRGDSLSAVFGNVANGTDYPISVEDFKQAVRDAYDGDANEKTIIAYLSWIKRKGNPFGVVLEQTEEGEEKVKTLNVQDV